jgi:proteasome lid subunit RPN8/RPN11
VLVIITQSQSQAIYTHAEQTYPEECCGLLLGTCQRRNELTKNNVMEVLPAINTWSQSPFVHDASHSGEDRRYAIDPVFTVKAQQYARANGWDIIGIYHSHPNHEAVPSEWDRLWAWPQYSYLIVSVKNGTAQDLRSWTLDTRHEFLPEKLVISGATDPQVMPNLEDTI